MSKQIFPASITDFCTETLVKKHSTKSKIIYFILLVSLVIFLISVFFITVDVNVQARGIITTKEKTNIVYTSVYGKIKKINIYENTYVKKGDTILIIDTVDIKRSIYLAKENIFQTESYINDLSIITNLSKDKVFKFVKIETEKYKQEFQKFISDISFQKSEISILEKEQNRKKQLFDKNLVALSEFEQIDYQLKSAKLKYNQIFESQMSAWQSELTNNKLNLLSLNENLVNYEHELQKYFILSPTSGFIQNLSGIKQGSIVFPNQEICYLSPDELLLVETYISTIDIGNVYVGQNVKYRIDAFNSNTWGFINGKIVEIANDVTISENQMPLFKVICSLENKELKYKNTTVSVKKGMTLTANIILMQRTISQILYDKTSDWINPSIINKN